uniref:Ig-like domain-containing protein n=1 Tax=Panagrolaimus sp. JU765 TaxID=591449 RepID=A0AC34PUG5_9BILA
MAQPQPPKLLTNRTRLSLEEGKNVDISCQSTAGKPAPTIGWVILAEIDPPIVDTWIANASTILQHANLNGNKEKPTYSGNVKTENTTNKDGFESLTSRLTFPISKLEDKKYLACVAIHPMYDSYKLATIALDVLYAPSVEIKLDENRSNLEEGGQAVLTCHADAKPSENVRIQWTKNDQALEPAGPYSVIIRNLRMEDHQHKVICHAQNAVGKSQAVYKLNIHYGPRIMTTSQTKAVQRGEPVTFVCEATGNPEPEIHWIRKTDTDMIIAKGSKFVIDSVQPWQIGQYDCVANVPGFSPAVIHNYLHLKGPPMIDFTENFIKYENDKVIMTCLVRGKPFPKNILWYKEGRLINFDHSKGRIQAQEVQKEFGVESKLTIVKATEKDYGMYNCSAINDFGSHSMGAELKEPTIVEKLINYGVNPIAILALAIFLLLLLILLLCCLKKNCCRNKKTTPFSDVTVRCEALDGVQFFADAYNPGEIDNVEMISSKDYISVPQNNPDLDYLPPPNVIYQPMHNYIPHPNDYSLNDPNIRYEQSCNSFLPSNGHIMDMYGNAYLKHSGHLETLAEVATPDTESGTPLLLTTDAHDRAVSQMSTHV